MSIFAYMIFCPTIRVSSPPLYRCSALSPIPVYKCRILTITALAIKLHITTFTADSFIQLHKELAEGIALHKNFWTTKQIRMMTQLAQHHHPHHQSLRIFKIHRTPMNCNHKDGKSLTLGKIQSHNERPCKGQMALGKSKGHLF